MFYLSFLRKNMDGWMLSNFFQITTRTVFLILTILGTHDLCAHTQKTGDFRNFDFNFFGIF